MWKNVKIRETIYTIYILSMFSVQFCVNCLRDFYIFSHYQSLLQKKVYMCNILFIVLIF